MSDHSTPRVASSPDEGEVSDDSVKVTTNNRDKDEHENPTKSGGSSAHSANSPYREKRRKHKHHSKDKKEKGDRIDEEDRLRRKLLERREKDRDPVDTDDEEMLTIQPLEMQKARTRMDEKEKERERRREREKEREKEKERERERHAHASKHKSDRRDRDRERLDDRHSSSRDRSKHDISSRLQPPVLPQDRRMDMNKSSHSHRDRPGADSRDNRDKRIREDPRDRHDKNERTDKERKHKRSRSKSITPERERKRERRISSDKDKKRDYKEKEVKEKESLKKVVLTNEVVVEVVDVDIEKSPIPMEEDKKEAEITSFELDSPAGPKKYSKFDSTPEVSDDEGDQTPVLSEVEYVGDEEEEMSIDNMEDKLFEDLTDEQKATLSPDTKKRMEDAWQNRLIQALPVFYPGISGCRNVAEFECVNRIEEGTFGVVFRGKDKRTDEIVALKRLKMEKEKDGFPITSLREINMLLKAGNHPNIVNVREVLIGSNMDKIYVAMEFVEHDMKSLMDTMHKKGKNFTTGELKTLMLQLLSGLNHMHDLFILHRDLKTSNLLLSHKGILKIADFGLAREFGMPLKDYTPIVVTLWYRAPELLLGMKTYSTPIDIWSIGCIMAEFMLLKPLFPGQGEINQLQKIFMELGTPSEKIWEGYSELPAVKQMTFTEYPFNQLRKKFPAAKINDTGFKLMNKLLTYDPERRITASEALMDQWFKEEPHPTPPELFPTFPAKSEQNKAPPPPKKEIVRREPVEQVSATTARLMADLNVRPDQIKSGFQLKFITR